METRKSIFEILPKPQLLKDLKVGSLFLFSPTPDSTTSEVDGLSLGYILPFGRGRHADRVRIFLFYRVEGCEEGVMAFSPKPKTENDGSVTSTATESDSRTVIPLNNVLFDADIVNLNMYNMSEKPRNEPSRLGNLVLCNVDGKEALQPGFVCSQTGRIDAPDDKILLLNLSDDVETLFHREPSYMIWQFTEWSGWIDGRKVFNVEAGFWVDFYNAKNDDGDDGVSESA